MELRTQFTISRFVFLQLTQAHRGVGLVWVPRPRPGQGQGHLRGQGPLFVFIEWEVLAKRMYIGVFSLGMGSDT